jgi:hypothetical protein
MPLAFGKGQGVFGQKGLRVADGGLPALYLGQSCVNLSQAIVNLAPLLA